MKRYGVALDVDGVLLRGHSVLPYANAALRHLRDGHVPHVLLTNGGGVCERTFAHTLAQRGLHGVQPEQCVLAHTPTQALVSELGPDALVCVLGRKSPVDAARQYGFRLAATAEQYCSVHSGLFAFESYDNVTVDEEVRHAIASRPLDAIMVFSDPLTWGRDIQLIVDAFAESAGLPPRCAAPRVIFCNADFHWSSSFPAPRFGQGAFIEAALAVFRRHYGYELPHQVLGKPTRATYEWVTQVLGPCERYYGVGDNQHSDIAGANAAGPRWRSVLVKSGLWSGEEAPSVEPHFIFNNVLEAVEAFE